MRVQAVVRGLSTNYTDGTERIEIYVQKSESQWLPIVEGKRVPIRLIVNGEIYQAGIRSTVDCDIVWISPNLIDAAGRDTKLAYVLPDAGFVKNQRVELEVTGHDVVLRAVGA